MQKSLRKSKRIYVLISIALILCLVMSFALENQSNMSASAELVTITGNGQADTISEILHLDRTSNARGDLVFNGNSLYNLYSKLTGKSVASLDDVKTIMADNAYDKKSTYANDNVLSIHYGLNAEDIRKVNGGNNIDVTMNGLVWEVAAVTTTGSNSDFSSGDVVLTLLLKTPLDGKTNWGGYTNESYNFKYPATMYSSSFIRAKLLNGKDYLGNEVKYTTDGSDLTSLESDKQIENYPFDIYTDIHNSVNITSFLVQPKDVLYQQYESLYTFSHANSETTTISSLAPNDATKRLDGVWYSDEQKAMQEIAVGNTVNGFTYTGEDQGYFDWANDYIWLPSITEIGTTPGGTDAIWLNNGLWALDESQRNLPLGEQTGAWLRSGRITTANMVYYIVGTGSQYVITQTASANTTTVSNGIYIRPALNLNLTLADESSETRFVPEDINIEYTGSALTVKDAANLGVAKWFTSAMENDVSIEYWEGSAKKESITEPGTYTVKFTISNTDKYFWYGTSETTKEITMKISPRKIPFPKWFNDTENSQVYNGGADLTYRLFYDSEMIEELDAVCGKGLFTDIADVSVSPSTNVTFDNTRWRFTAQDVAEYTATFSIKSSMQKYFEWVGAPSNNQLKFSVTKSPVKVSLTGEDSTTTALKGVYGGTLAAVIEVDAQYQPHTGKSISFYVQASASGLPKEKISDDFTITSNMLNESRWIDLTLNLSNLEEGTIYTLSLICSSAEYDLQLLTTNTIEVEKSVVSVMTWNLYVDGNRKIGYYCDQSTEQDVATFNKPITFDGKNYKFEVNLPSGYDIKRSEGAQGYEVVPGSGNANRAVGKNADTYTTKVYIYKIGEESNVLEYSINWEISQAKFDLSGVKWLGNGSLPYNLGESITMKLDEDTLPNGLIPNYSGEKNGTIVGYVGNIQVEFELEDAYVGNYVQPDENVSGSYNGSSFKWNIDWYITKATIQASNWQSYNYMDINNKLFEVYILRDPAAKPELNIVSYQYYECNSAGSITDNTPLEMNELIWSESEAKFYLAKAVLKDTNNYEFDNANAQSRVFKVGKALIKVTVTPNKTTFEYNTQPRNVSFTVGGQQTLPSSAFDVTYYEGFTMLTGAPVEVGTYRVEFALKSNYLSSHEIDGAYSFDITITTAEIAVQWNMQAKPPVLNLAYGQINAIEYVIVDNSGQEFGVNNLQAGVTYYIQAKIKANYQRNMKFVGGSYDTPYQSFTVTANDNLIDPNAPDNKFYPQDNPDAPSTGDPSTPSDPTNPSDPSTPTKTDITLEWDSNKTIPQLTSAQTSRLKPIYKYYGADGEEITIEDMLKGETYKVKVTFPSNVEAKYNISGDTEKAFVYKQDVVLEWNTEKFPPELVLDPELEEILKPEYEYYDKDGNLVNPEDMVEGEDYTVKVSFADGTEDEYNFVDKDGNIVDVSEAINPYENSDSGIKSKFVDFVKNYWQPVVSGLCIVLTVLFIARAASYISKKKENKKTIERKYSTFYAVGLFGLSSINWTIIASVLIGITVLSLVFMLIAKSGYKKSLRELEEAKEESENNKKAQEKEELKRMFMMMGGAGGMNGAGQQGGFAYAGQGFGTEEMKGMISEVVAALLPGVQQMLPQQASTNDELVQKLLEKTTKNEEEMRKLIKKIAEQPSEKEAVSASVSEEVLDRLASKLQPVANEDKAMKNLIEGQNAIMQRLAEQPVVQSASDETILKVVSHSEQNDETIKRILDNQEKLMEKILELSANQNTEPQVIEKIVEKPVERIVEMPVEKIVEKEVKVEVPVEVEKVVEKIVEVPVEKIVEKEVVKEVPVEVEKVVEKIVEIPAAKPAPKVKTAAPRLTLDEAYEKLSAKQKKIFDTLRAYAMSKDKCKEKKSTYYILLGQSSVNPLVKLTIKKDTTVALFKMEDEFMKDIRRNATNDGTKVKVKETELIVGDMQALATAKEMVDLREDQIERYNEYMREQRSMKK